MKITQFDSQPILEIPFLNAGKGQGSFYKDILPVHLAQVDRLPDNTQAIIATADLQGRETFKKVAGRTRPPKLLGEVLPGLLSESLLPELNLNPEKCGTILAGDFYTVPNLDKRGGSGDVSEVWKQFESHFAWTVGVAGNHDTFGDREIHSRLPKNLLDGELRKIEGCRFAGLSGIIGNPKRKWRRLGEEYCDLFFSALQSYPDVAISHDGPSGLHEGQTGNLLCRQLMETSRPTLLIRGHAHWNEPFCELANGAQILNVDCRVAILTEKAT